jgi:Arc/MetJ family transcription regulator
MGRTNVVIDDELLERAMRLYGLRTKREAIDFALRRLVGESRKPLELADHLEDSDWWGQHFEAIRGHPVGE